MNNLFCSSFAPLQFLNLHYMYAHENQVYSKVPAFFFSVPPPPRITATIGSKKSSIFINIEVFIMFQSKWKKQIKCLDLIYSLHLVQLVGHVSVLFRNVFC